MSKLPPPLVPLFSAAHISKWDALPEDAHVGLTEAKVLRPSGKDRPNDSDDTCRSAECETTRVQGAAIDSAKSDSHEHMATTSYTWITLWFLLTAPVILWDATYCFFRPRSMVGGDLHWIWEPYGIYQNIDLVYGIKALEDNNGFTNAQSLLNLVETTLNLAYVYLVHVSGWSGAPLIGMIAATMTLSKTLLYWAQEYYCGGCAIGHNALRDLLLYYVLPNGLWIVFPGMIVWRLGHDILGALSVASRSGKRAAIGKMQ